MIYRIGMIAWIPATLALFWSAGMGSAAHASDVELFDRYGDPVAKYNELAGGLESGKVLLFPDGKRFEITGKLGKGGFTYIYSAREVFPSGARGENFALRLNQAAGMFSLPFPGEMDQNFLKATAEGYAGLKNTEVLHPKLLYPSEYYLGFEIIPHHFSLQDWLLSPRVDSSYTEKQIHDALIEFARSTAEVRSLSDFKAFQIVFDDVRGKWVLLDWANVVERMDLITADTESMQRTLFSQRSEFAAFIQAAAKRQGQRSEFLLKKVDRAINELESVVQIERRNRIYIRCLGDQLRLQ